VKLFRDLNAEMAKMGSCGRMSLNSALDQYERGKLRFSPFRSTFFRPGLKYINRFEFRDFSAANEVE
jgi:hypothetical protein